MGREGADEEEDHVEEDLGADLVGGLGEDQVAAQGEDLVAGVEVKAHVTLVTREVSGTEELLKAFVQQKRNLVHSFLTLHPSNYLIN